MKIDETPNNRTKHSIHSMLRENIIEHLFIAEILRSLWRKEIFDAEVLKSQFDAGGYDLVLTRGDITRHIQLKITVENGSRREIDANLRLSKKPSGCIIWIIVDDNLEIKSYKWFGGSPGLPLPEISHMAISKHTKGDASGTKNERVGHRQLKATAFTKIDTLDALLIQLLGENYL